MSTIIDLQGRLKAYGDQTLVQSAFGAFGNLCGVKVVRSSLVNASAGVNISWESAIFDTGKFVTSFPTANIVIPQSGWYAVVAYINTSEHVQHKGSIQIIIGGTAVDADRVHFDGVADASKDSLNIAVPFYYCTKGDIVNVHWDTDGIDVDLEPTGEGGCSCAVWRVA